jgi:ATP-dependent exoDNAse (exonuclease V) alpha subunit
VSVISCCSVLLPQLARNWVAKRNQMLRLHKTSSNFQAYGTEYRRFQLTIINALALTIHKVQGLSLPSLTIALNQNIFSDGQSYVALRRGRELEKLFASYLDFDAIKANYRRFIYATVS